MQDQKKMIEEINDAVREEQAELNDWETEFLSSIAIQLADGRTLSNKQDAKLEEIWKRVKGFA